MSQRQISSSETATTTSNAIAQPLKVEFVAQGNSEVLTRAVGQAVDFSQMLEVPVSLFRYGDSLQIVYAGGGNLVVEGFFAEDNQAAELILSETQTLTIEQFGALVNIVPVDTLQTAAGEASPIAEQLEDPASSGLNVEDPNVGDLGPGLLVNDLLRPEDRAGLDDTDRELNAILDTNPIVLGAADTGALDEEVWDNTDGEPQAISFTGGLNIDFGLDGAESRSLEFIVDATGTPLDAAGSPLDLTADGQPLSYDITTVATGPSAGSQLLTASLPNGEPVFTVLLNTEPTNGEYTFTLLGNMDHPIANAEDILSLTFGFRALDADGDAVTSSLQMDITDDLPEFTPQDPEVISEQTLPASAQDLAPSVTGSLGIDWGADDANTPSETSDAGDRSVVFQPELNNTSPAGLTSAGEQITYQILNGGTLLQATTAEGETPVFTISLNDVTGEFTFTLNRPLDHKDGDTLLDDIALNIGFVAKDADGDATTGSFTVTVNDDTPTVDPETNADRALTEADLSPTDIRADDPVVSAGLGIDWGADNSAGRSIAFADGTIAAFQAMNLTTEGQAITYQIFDLPEGQSLIAVNSTTGELVFQIQLSEQGQGTYRFQLHEPLDHKDGDTLLDDIALNIGFVAKDADGDATTGSFTVTVNDDTPTVDPETNADRALTEADLSPTDIRADDPVVSAGLGIDWGADNSAGRSIAFADGTIAAFQAMNLTTEGQATTYQIFDLPEGQSLIAVNSTTGELVFQIQLSEQGQGTYRFQLHEPLDHKDGDTLLDNIALNIGFVAKDADGDATTGSFTVTVNDDTPTVDPETNADRALTEADLSPTDIRADDPVVSAGLGIDWGADNSAGRSIAFANGTIAAFQTMNLTTEGQAITYQIFDLPEGQSLIAVNSTTGELVFQIQLSEQGQGTYRFQLHEPLDHKDGDTLLDDIALNIGFVAKDADGDATTGSFTVTVNDDTPTVDPETNADRALTEADLSPTDIRAEDPVVSAGLGIDWGADNSAGRSIAFADGTIAAFQTMNLTTEGQAITYQIFDLPEGQSLIAVNSTTGELVFQIQLSEQGQGTYRFQLHEPLDHKDGDTLLDDIALNIGFVAKDADGDATTGSFTVTVNDDTPTVDPSAIEDGFVNENGLPGGDTPGQDLTDTGELGIDWGSDDSSARTLQFDPDLAGEQTLTSGGEPLVYQLNADKTELTAVTKQGGVPVFTVTLDKLSGEYTFTLKQPLDHKDGQTLLDQLDLQFGFIAKDADGDKAEGTFTITVKDDTPSAGAIPDQPLFEADLPAEGSADPLPSVNGDLQLAYGADSGSASDVRFSQVGHSSVTVGGEAIKVAYLGKVAIGYTGDTAPDLEDLSADNLVFRATLSDDGTGSYTFTLHKPLDHTGIYDDSARFQFRVDVIDSDGDKAQTFFSVNVKDDTPTVDPETNADRALTEADLSPTDIRAEDPVVSTGLGIDWGADNSAGRSIAFADGTIAAFQAMNLTTEGQAITYQIFDLPEGQSLIAVNSTTGELVFQIQLSEQGQGTYRFQLHEPLDHKDGDTLLDDIALNIGFVAKDADGDATTGSFTVTVNDDTPTVDPSAIEDGFVNENGLPGGDTPGQDLTDTGELGIDWGSDDSSARTLQFDPDLAGEQTLTSGGEPLVYQLNADKTELTAVTKQGGVPVFTVTLDKLSGEYTFTLKQPLDHKDGQTLLDQLDLQFGFIAKDADGDKAEGTFTITVKDDTPSAGAIPDQPLFEADLPAEGSADPLPSVNGDLQLAYGADSGSASDVRFSQVGHSSVTVGGEAIKVAYLGKVAIGYTGDTAPDLEDLSADNLVFRATLSDDGTGSYTFTLHKPLDHTGIYDDSARFQFRVDVIDSDGDKAQTFFSVNVKDDTPTVDPETNADRALTEADLSPTDIRAEDPVVSTGLGIDWGADNSAGRSIAFADGTIAAFQAMNLTTEGQAITYQIFDLPEGQSLIAVNSTTGELVFQIQLSEQGQGTYRFQLHEPLDHKDGDTLLDNIALNIGFVAKDADGDATTGSFTVTVNDDTPTVDPSAIEDGFVNENGLPGGDTPGQDLTDTGELGIDWGSDDGSARTLQFDPDLAGEQTLTSGGEPLVYQLNADKTELTAVTKQGGVPVFTVTLDKQSGEYTFTLKQPLDHKDGQTLLDQLDLQFGFIAKDADDDEAEGTFTITVKDDTPSAGAIPDQPLFEADLPAEGSADPLPSVNGDLQLAYGADSGSASEIRFSQVGHSSVTVGGEAIKVAYLGKVAIGYTGDTAPDLNDLSADNLVFRATLSDDGTGSYTFTLHKPLDHTGIYDDSARFQFRVDVIDSDGDKAQTFFSVNVKDDTPSITNGPTVDINEAGVYSTADSDWTIELDTNGGTNTFSIEQGESRFSISGDDVDGTVLATPENLGSLWGATKVTKGNFGADDPETPIRVNSSQGGAPYKVVLSGKDIGGAYRFEFGTEAEADKFASFLQSAKDQGLLNELLNDHASYTAKGDLGVDWGADDNNPLPKNAGEGDRSLSFDDSTKSALEAMELESEGAALTYSINPKGTTLTARNAETGELVFKVELNDKTETGSFKFSLNKPLDHTDPNGESMPLVFNYTATDSDGDQADGSFTINVLDDTANTGIADPAIADEDGLSKGIGDQNIDDDLQPSATENTASGSLNINWGVDNIDARSIEFDLAQTTLPQNLKSNGEPVKLATLSDGTLVGYTGNAPTANNLVFEVTLQGSGSGSYTFKLLNNLDHPVVGVEDNLSLTFSYTAKDGDQDEAPGTFTVQVDDDMPVIDPANVTNDEVTETAYTVSGANLITNGSFEESVGILNTDPAYNGVAWHQYTPTGAWQTTGGTYIEIQDTGFLDLPAQQGNRYLEVDARSPGQGGNGEILDEVFQQVQTEDGKQYLLEFYLAARPINGDPQIDTVSVRWNGEEIATEFAGSTDGWQKVSLTVTGTGGLDKLAFAEIAGQNNSFGVLIDNVSLREITTTQNPDEQTATGDLGINWGADDGPARSVELKATSFADLTSNGQAVKTALVGGILLGYVGNAHPQSADDPSVVFSVSTSPDAGGKYTFTLLGNLDHSSQDPIDLNFEYVAKDSDGDPSSTGTFTVTVNNAEITDTGQAPSLAFHNGEPTLFEVGENFHTRSYANDSYGNKQWLGDWTPSGDDGSPITGDMSIEDVYSRIDGAVPYINGERSHGQVVFNEQGQSLSRSVDLSNADLSKPLNLTVWKDHLLESGDSFTLTISWKTIENGVEVINSEAFELVDDQRRLEDPFEVDLSKLPDYVPSVTKLTFTATRYTEANTADEYLRVWDVQIKGTEVEPPVSDQTITFERGRAGVLVAENIRITDPDADDKISKAEIEISQNGKLGDILFFAPKGIYSDLEVTVSDNGNSLVLTGEASREVYEAALQSIYFNSNDATDVINPRTIDIRVYDDTGLASETVQTTVNMVNLGRGADLNTANETAEYNGVDYAAIKGSKLWEVIRSEDDVQNFLDGRGGNDRILSGETSDVIRGGGGYDVIISGSDNDTDTIILNRLDGSFDNIIDFDGNQVGEGDTTVDQLDITALLNDAFGDAGGEFADQSKVNEYVRIEQDGDNANVLVDSNGGGDNWSKVAVLQDVSLGETIKVVLDDDSAGNDIYANVSVVA